MSLPDLYRELVLEHNRKPRHAVALPAPTHVADGENPLCGDTLRCTLVVADGRVQAAAFETEACAITTACASLLAETAHGQPAEALLALAERFEAALATGVEDPALGPFNTLLEVRRYPGRQRCASLPFATLRAALTGQRRASTESRESTR